MYKRQVLEEANPISSEVSVNTLTLSFHTEQGTFDLLDLTGAYVLFQQRQRADVTGWIDGMEMNMGTFYLDKPTTTESLSLIHIYRFSPDRCRSRRWWSGR